MRPLVPPVHESHRYRMRLIVEETASPTSSFLLNRLQLSESDSAAPGCDVGRLAERSRAHAQLDERDRYVVAFALSTLRRLLAQAGGLSPDFRALRQLADELAADGD